MVIVAFGTHSVSALFKITSASPGLQNLLKKYKVILLLVVFVWMNGLDVNKSVIYIT